MLIHKPGITSPEVHGTRITLPLELVPIDGSAYQLVTLDLGADLQLGRPGAVMQRILSVRMGGQFEVGDIVLATRSMDRQIAASDRPGGVDDGAARPVARCSTSALRA